ARDVRFKSAYSTREETPLVSLTSNQLAPLLLLHQLTTRRCQCKFIRHGKLYVWYGKLDMSLLSSNLGISNRPMRYLDPPLKSSYCFGTIFEISRYAFIEESTHKIAENSSTTNGRFCSSWSSAGRHSPRVSVDLMFYMKPSLADCDKYTQTKESSRTAKPVLSCRRVFRNVVRSFLYGRRTEQFVDVLCRNLFPDKKCHLHSKPVVFDC
ncbi:hypothetical protein CLF_113593, partial [Clonorchis sinensis]